VYSIKVVLFFSTSNMQANHAGQPITLCWQQKSSSGERGSRWT